MSGDERPSGPPPSRGRRRRPDARRDRYAPDELTGEVVVPTDMFGLAVESPGVAQQPLAPWMTGEHQAISLDEPPPYLDEARAQPGSAPTQPDHDRAYPGGAPGYPDADRAYPGSAPTYPDARRLRPARRPVASPPVARPGPP
ncbi:MAG: hypothetical protein ACRD0R_03500, partial [Acidimicrobiales bacterium]